MENIDLIIKTEKKATEMVEAAEKEKEITIEQAQEAIKARLKDLSTDVILEVNAILQKGEAEMAEIKKIEIAKRDKEIIILENKIKQNMGQAVSFVLDKINGGK